MASPSLPLYIAIGVLMVDSIIELSFVSSMVAWLHRRAGGSFQITNSSGNGSSTYLISGRPLHLILDQGHTSNGSAGTAFVLIGMGGILVLFLRSRANLWQHGWAKGLYHFWLVMTIFSCLLTFSALIYTFVVTNNHKHQSIDQGVAAQQITVVPYPLDTWTPENWFAALLQLDITQASDRSDIRSHLDVMRGWRWNLIPMFIIGLAVAVLAMLDAFKRRGQMRATHKQQQQQHTDMKEAEVDTSSA